VEIYEFLLLTRKKGMRNIKLDAQVSVYIHNGKIEAKNNAATTKKKQNLQSRRSLFIAFLSRVENRPKTYNNNKKFLFVYKYEIKNKLKISFFNLNGNLSFGKQRYSGR
jgi:hypothetical protein